MNAASFGSYGPYGPGGPSGPHRGMFHWPFGFNGATGPTSVVQKEKTTGTYKTVMPRNGDHVHFVMTAGMINLHNARHAKGIWSHEPRAYMTLAGDAYRMLIFDLVFAQAEDDEASNGPNGAGGPRRYFAFHEIDALDVWTRHREAIDADDALVLAKMGQGPGSLRANLADALAKRHDAVMLYGNMEQTKGRTYAFLSFFAEFADAADPVPHDTLEPIERIARAALVAKADRAAAMAKLMTGPTESWNSWLFGALLDAACDVLAVVGVYGKEAWNMMNWQVLVANLLGSEAGKLFARVIGANKLVCLVILLVEISITVMSIISATAVITGPVSAALVVLASSALHKAGSNCPSIMAYLGPLVHSVAAFVSTAGKESKDFAIAWAKIKGQLNMKRLGGMGALIAYSTVDAVAVGVLKSIFPKHVVCLAKVCVHFAVASTLRSNTIGQSELASEYELNIVPHALRIGIAHGPKDNAKPTSPPNGDATASGVNTEGQDKGGVNVDSEAPNDASSGVNDEASVPLADFYSRFFSPGYSSHILYEPNTQNT